MTRPFMAPFAILTAILAVACTEASAPGIPLVDPVAGSDKDVEATITQLERDWVTAIVKKDAATINRLLADDFNGTSPTAHVYPKTSAIEDLTRNTLVVDSMDLDEISVNVYGNVAVAFTSQEEKSRYGGVDTSGHYHYTDVWVKKDGRWQVVASHGSRYDKGHESS